MYGKIAIVAASLAAVASAAPVKGNSTIPHLQAIAAVPDSYQFHTGNGSPEAGWPNMDQWASYDDLWNYYSSFMPQTCGWNSVPGGENSPQEIADVGTAIQQVSGETGVDARFILSIVMQESKGCVRVGGTENGVTNPGLMQSHNGAGTCAGINPCPYDTILLMIRDGTAGTAFGDGLRQTLDYASGQLGGISARAYYAAARKYNSGSVDLNDLNNRFTSTGCYATDVANRLQNGWLLATTGCPLSP